MRLTILATALSCAAGLLPAQQSGLLLGVRLPSGYRTLWITPDMHAPRVDSGPDLIVPGRRGFSRVCTVPYHELEDGQLSVGDSLVIARVDLPRGACALDDSVDDAEYESSHCSSTSELQVTFAGPAALGLESSAEYNCGAHPDGETHAWLQRLEGDTIPFRSALTPAQRKRWRARADAAGEKEFADFGVFNGGTMDDERAHLGLDDVLGIERGAGHWQAIGRVSCSPHVACGSGSFRLSIPGFVLPRSLTGHDMLRPAFASIVARFPRATDAFSSPSGDVVAVVDADTLRVLVPHGGKLGSPVMSIPFEGTVVMIEWATGRFVAQWSEQLSTIFAMK